MSNTPPPAAAFAFPLPSELAPSDLFDRRYGPAVSLIRRWRDGWDRVRGVFDELGASGLGLARAVWLDWWLDSVFWTPPLVVNDLDDLAGVIRAARDVELGGGFEAADPIGSANPDACRAELVRLLTSADKYTTDRNTAARKALLREFEGKPLAWRLATNSAAIKPPPARRSTRRKAHLLAFCRDELYRLGRPRAPLVFPAAGDPRSFLFSLNVCEECLDQSRPTPPPLPPARSPHAANFRLALDRRTQAVTAARTKIVAGAMRETAGPNQPAGGDVAVKPLGEWETSNRIADHLKKRRDWAKTALWRAATKDKEVTSREKHGVRRLTYEYKTTEALRYLSGRQGGKFKPE